MGNFLLNEDPLIGLLPFAGALALLALLLYLFRRNERLRAFRFPWYVGWPLALAIIAFGLYTIFRLMNFRRLFTATTGWHRALVETLDEVGPFHIAAAVAGPGLLILLWGLYAGWIRAARFPKRMCPACRYDMTALPASRQCPECGRTFKRERDLFPFRRSRRLAIVGVVVILLGGGLGYFTFSFTSSGGSLPSFLIVRMVTVTDNPSEEALDLLAQRIRKQGGLSRSQRQTVLDRAGTLPISTAAQLLNIFLMSYPNDADVATAKTALDTRITSALSSNDSGQIAQAAAALTRSNLTPAELIAIFQSTGAGANPLARPYLAPLAQYSLQISPTSLDATLSAPSDPVFAQAALQCSIWNQKVPSAAQLQKLLALNDPAVTSTARIFCFVRDPSEKLLDQFLADPESHHWIGYLFPLCRSPGLARTDAQLEQTLTMLDARYAAMNAPLRDAFIASASTFYDKPGLINPHLRRWRALEPDAYVKTKLEDFPPYP